MAEIIVIRNTYGGLRYLKSALDYVSDERALYQGGYGVNSYSSNDAYNQMTATKAYYNKRSGNPLIHVVISYDSKVKDAETAASYGQKCAAYFASDYQVKYSTHNKDTGCSSYHTHLIINSVSYVDGHMFNSSYENMNLFCEYVAGVTGQKTQLHFKNKANQLV